MKKQTTTQLNAAGWVRLVLYVLSALVGVAAVVATTLGYDAIAGLLGTLAGVGASVTGGTAVANLPKAPDQQPMSGFNLTEILQAIPAIANAAQTYKAGTAAPASTPAPAADRTATSGLPVYDLPSAAGTAADTIIGSSEDYVGQHRSK